jgi:hypothetical protein
VIADLHDSRRSGIKGRPMRQSGTIGISGIDKIDPVTRHAVGNLAIQAAVGSIRRGIESIENIGYFRPMEGASAR